MAQAIKFFPKGTTIFSVGAGTKEFISEIFEVSQFPFLTCNFRSYAVSGAPQMTGFIEHTDDPSFKDWDTVNTVSGVITTENTGTTFSLTAPNRYVRGRISATGAQIAYVSFEAVARESS